MRRACGALLALALLLLGVTAPAGAQEVELTRLRVALPDGPSPRTLGFHLAEMEGQFTQLGLDPVFVRADDRGPVAMLEDGDVDLAIDIMPHALKARENGAGILHIAQFFQKSGLLLACRRPIAEPADLKGANIELRFDGQESAFFAWMHKLGLGIYGEADGVTILREGRETDFYRGKESDCFTTESYLLPGQLAVAGKTPADFRLFPYEELGTSTLEDGLYARDEDLADPERVDLFAQFVAGARAGWQRAAEEPRKAAETLMSLAARQTGAQSPDLPTLIRGVWAVNDLVAVEDAEFGHLDPAAYDRTVTVLLTGAPDPNLKSAPLGAVTDAVIKRVKSD
jgi:NitT/TauT family transport system substrate-binding protein